SMLAAVCSSAPKDTAAVTSAQQSTRPPTSNAQAPVVLPDLSGLAESAQRQIRDREAQLRQIEHSASPPSKQAAAYAALGRMLMAAKFNDAAASCYLHAETLSPDDMRWPYFAGHAFLRKGERTQAAAAFERALKVRPADLTSLVWLGETYLDDDRLELAQSAF